MGTYLHWGWGYHWAGIFVMSGVGAREFAGPALALSFVMAGISYTFAALCCVEFAFSLGFHNWVRLFAWLALGIAIYFFYGRKHSKLNKSVSAENSTKPFIPA